MSSSSDSSSTTSSSHSMKTTELSGYWRNNLPQNTNVEIFGSYSTSSASEFLSMQQQSPSTKTHTSEHNSMNSTWATAKETTTPADERTFPKMRRKKTSTPPATRSHGSPHRRVHFHSTCVNHTYSKYSESLNSTTENSSDDISKTSVAVPERGAVTPSSLPSHPRRPTVPHTRTHTTTDKKRDLVRCNRT